MKFRQSDSPVFTWSSKSLSTSFCLAATLIACVSLANISCGQGRDDVIYYACTGDEGQLMPLISHRKVRIDIELSQAQYDELRPHLDRWQATFKRDQPDKFRDQSKWIKILDDVLLPHQMERLEQIHWQAMGLHVLGSPRFTKQLKMTKKESEEFASIRKYLQIESKKISEKGPEAKDNPQRVAEMMKTVQTRVKALLPEERQREFKKLLGKPFDMEGVSRPKF